MKAVNAQFVQGVLTIFATGSNTFLLLAGPSVIYQSALKIIVFF